MQRPSAVVALLLGVLGAPPARAGEVYTYTDADGVIHFTNAPTDSRFRKVKARGGQSLYRGGGQVRETRIPRTQALERWRESIRLAAQRYGLPEALLLAVMAVESNFDHQAVSEKGAMGLMQLMPGTAREMYVSDAWDPHQNIEGGARYLRVLANRYRGDMVLTLAAYNAGPDAVRRAGDAVPGIPETQEYVRRVVALYQAFKAGK
jgi:soluble lytic murein transglycosylase-like protein